MGAASPWRGKMATGWGTKPAAGTTPPLPPAGPAAAPPGPPSRPQTTRGPPPRPATRPALWGGGGAPPGGGIGASTGNAGVGIGLDVGVIIRHTTAWIGTGADVTATTGDIKLKATSDDDITAIAATFGLSTSGAGVAASIAVQVLTTETRAYTEDTVSGPGHTTLTAGGDIAIESKADFKALMIAGAVGVGDSAGVGVANTTLVHLDTAAARVGAYNVVNSAGTNGIDVKATSTRRHH